MISIHTSISNLRGIYWMTGHLPFDVAQALEPERLLTFGSLHALLSRLEQPRVLSLSSTSSLSFKTQACAPSPGNLFGITLHILELFLFIHSALYVPVFTRQLSGLKCFL